MAARGQKRSTLATGEAQEGKEGGWTSTGCGMQFITCLTALWYRVSHAEKEGHAKFETVSHGVG